MATLASAKNFSAGSSLPPAPAPTLDVAGSVSRVRLTEGNGPAPSGSTLRVTDAWPVTLPALAGLEVRGVWPAALVALGPLTMTMSESAMPLEPGRVTAGVTPAPAP